MNLCIPKMCLTILLSATTIREFLGLWFSSYKFCSRLPELYVIMYVYSFRVLTYNCTFVHVTTHFFANMRKEPFLFYHISWVMSWSQISTFSGNFLSSTCYLYRLVFPPNPCLYTCWSTKIFFVLISLAWILRSIHLELILLDLAHNSWIK
jgi:hypothetical protein